MINVAAAKIAVLYGGASAEREVSLNSGRAVFDALISKGVDAHLIDTQNNVIAQLLQLNPDAAFIVVHGRGGEDGQLQAVLEQLKIPYTGSGITGSAIAMDKLLCKRVWSGMGLPISEYEVLDEKSCWRDVEHSLGNKVVVKPVCEGSSVGVSIARDSDEFEKAKAVAFACNSEVIAERFMKGREFTVPVLGNQALPSIQLVPANEFYDYDAKYIQDDTTYLIPSGLSNAQEQCVRELALKAFQSVGCSGWGRVDFIEHEPGDIRLMELNTVPGMTSHSLVPMSAASIGIDFPELCSRIVSMARLNSTV
ncbi:MAG: D-alanine--D-alanine ligase [Gammaproteobacteria bacterium]|nr:D-alanine--D-alanine ligase [Gammaproteobacteria bacterium]